MSTNRTILVGNLGGDPVTRHLESGDQVSQFSLATTERWTDKAGNKKEATEWHNVQVWRGLSKVASENLKKGDKIYLEGKLKYESYQKNDETRYVTKVVAEKIDFLKVKKFEVASSGEVKNDDDLPF